MTTHVADYDFSRCKSCGESDAERRYPLKSGHAIYVCPHCDLHYIDYLDDTASMDTDDDLESLDADTGEFIRSKLQYNRQRFQNQVDAVVSAIDPHGARVLDIGAGGGLFLAMMRERGAVVEGLDPRPERRAFALERYGIELEAAPFDAQHAREDRAGTYDVVTLWDVIEHVNFPRQTMQLAARLLRPGGILAIDTPARDSAFYQVGQLSSRLSSGRFATFLNVLYSARPFEHKQILSLEDLRRYARDSGLEVERCHQFRELSFPATSYLERHMQSRVLARAIGRVVERPIKQFGPRNKALLLARRPG